MPAKIRNITRDYPRWVPVLAGSPLVLVDQRQLINKYEVNRVIKYWATWYLLKSLTTTGFIQSWTEQKKYLLTYLQMNEPTLRAQLAWLSEKNLLSVDKKTRSIRLTSYEHAAQIMGITYQGTYQINYNYDTLITPPPQSRGRKRRPIVIKQSFQYLLRAEEFERRKQRSLNALLHKLDNNPSLRGDLLFLMMREGCDNNRLHNDPAYFQQRLLQLQIRYFRDGSDLLEYVCTHRADINRGVKKIAAHHGYRSPQSVSYLKKRMHRLGIIDVQKLVIVSSARSRLYIPDTEHGGTRPGYKWMPKDKTTALFLCDQVSARYQTDLLTTRPGEIKKTA